MPTGRPRVPDPVRRAGPEQVLHAACSLDRLCVLLAACVLAPACAYVARTCPSPKHGTHCVLDSAGRVSLWA